MTLEQLNALRAKPEKKPNAYQIPKPTFKDRVMEGRPKQARKENVRTPAQVLAAAEAFRKFREYAKTL